MDFHKLQQTLNDIEPSDPAQDIERLRQAAQGNNAPSLREPVAESRDYSAEQPVPKAPQRELNEAEEFAALAGITPSSSKQQPVNDVASEMAALAGIRLDERQKTGRAGQAMGKDPMPKKSKPSKSGEQKHPLKDKLVGSSEGYEEKDVDDVEEGMWDDVKKAGKQGWKNYNSPSALKGVTKAGKSSKPSKTSKSSKSSKQSQSNELPPNVAKALAPYATALTNVLKDPKKKDMFDRLMATADPSLKKESVHESDTARNERTNTIKEDLLRRLNSKK